jgi:predicted nucleic acid-binding protein
MKAIADTGFLVAFGNRSDRHHRWALELAARIAEPLLTCEAVLTESAWLLRSVGTVMGMLQSGLVSIAFDLKENQLHIDELASRYKDLNPDLCDMCIVRMSELFPRHSVITTDRRDFSIYKRNKRDAIPVILPPAG